MTARRVEVPGDQHRDRIVGDLQVLTLSAIVANTNGIHSSTIDVVELLAEMLGCFNRL